MAGFNEIVGHEQIVEHLKNAISSIVVMFWGRCIFCKDMQWLNAPASIVVTPLWIDILSNSLHS